MHVSPGRQVRELPGNVEEAPLGGGPDLWTNKNNLVIGFTYGLLDGHLTCNTDTDQVSVDSPSEKKFLSFPRLIEPLSRPLVCAPGNKTSCSIYHIYMVKNGNKLYMLFLRV